MKKKIFGALVVVAIAAGVMMNVNLNKVSNKADLATANVEALADPAEGGGGGYCGTPAKCGSTTTNEIYTTTRQGYTWSVGANAWFLNGNRTNTWPADYLKSTTTVTSSWDGCKPTGTSSCYAPPC